MLLVEFHKAQSMSHILYDVSCKQFATVYLLADDAKLNRHVLTD